MNESSVFVFPGTLLERRDLAAAIAHNCACRMEDLQVERCARHMMVLGETPADRRVVEGLLYVRRALLPKLRLQEFRA